MADTPTHGNDGVVKAVTTGGAVAQVDLVKSWRLRPSAGEIRTTEMGDTTEKRDAGRKDWEVELTVHWGPNDTAQADLIEGAKVDLELYPGGEGASENYYTGTGIVTDAPASGTMEDETVEQTVTIKADGALTRAVTGP